MSIWITSPQTTIYTGYAAVYRDGTGQSPGDYPKGGVDIRSTHARFRKAIEAFRRDVKTLWFIWHHPDVPRGAKILAAVVLGYAISPIDLIPDFIPVFGQLDDLLLIPLGVYLMIRMIPKPVLESCRQRAAESGQINSTAGGWVAAGIILLWVGILVWLVFRFVPVLIRLLPAKS